MCAVHFGDDDGPILLLVFHESGFRGSQRVCLDGGKRKRLAETDIVERHPEELVARVPIPLYRGGVHRKEMKRPLVV